MSAGETCRACGRALPARTGPGRKAAYCSAACRRATEYARRRWDRRQRAIERHVRAWRGSGRSAVLARMAHEDGARMRRAAGPRP